MERTVYLSLQGNRIIVNPSSLDVQVGDTIKFVSDPNYYDVVIPNKDNFFVNNDNGKTIEFIVPPSTTYIPNPALAINNKPAGIIKYYTVTTPGGGITYAPPRIILIS